jgi:hypothetical protein
VQSGADEAIAWIRLFMARLYRFPKTIGDLKAMIAEVAHLG